MTPESDRDSALIEDTKINFSEQIRLAGLGHSVIGQKSLEILNRISSGESNFIPREQIEKMCQDYEDWRSAFALHQAGIILAGSEGFSLTLYGHDVAEFLFNIDSEPSENRT